MLKISQSLRYRRVFIAAVLVTGMAALAACGSNTDSSSASSISSGGGVSSAISNSNPGAGSGAESSAATGGGGGADVAAAQELLAPYLGRPGPFPDLPRLKSRPKAGSTISYLQCTAASCQVFADAIKKASDVLGVRFKPVVLSGASATDVQNAMATIVAQKPDAVVISAVDPTPITPQIKELVDAGTAVVSIGIINGEKFGIQAAVNSNDAVARYGRLLAAAAVRLHGDKTNVAFYNTSEMAFASLVVENFKSELTKLCPECPVREVSLTVSNPTGAPATVVADQQAHPDTNVGVFNLFQLASGLPAALSTAGITADMIGMAPSASQLGDIRNGGLTEAVTSAQTTVAWMAVDAAARLMTGERVPPGDTGLPPIQLLTKKDITFDAAKPWAPYDDAAKFSVIWQ